MISFFTGVGAWIANNKTAQQIIAVIALIAGFMTWRAMDRRDAVKDYKQKRIVEEQEELQDLQESQNEIVEEAKRARDEHGHYSTADELPERIRRHIIRD